MYRNKSKDMSFSQGDLMVRQVYMKEAGAMVWEILEFRRCAGQHADEGDHAWLAHDINLREPFATREQALAHLAEVEAAENKLAKAVYAWRDAGFTLD